MSIRTSEATDAIRITAGIRQSKRVFVVEHPPHPLPVIGEFLNMPDGSKLEIRKVQKIKGPLFFVNFPGMLTENSTRCKSSAARAETQPEKI